MHTKSRVCHSMSGAPKTGIKGELQSSDGCVADIFMNGFGRNCYGSNKIIKIPLAKHCGTMLL